ncbi:MAG: hypothetical protein KA004_00845 [Verrucomicrobiales bacterium]|nr:hypothetical protein [Verrucomicrobiales bacterium]
MSKQSSTLRTTAAVLFLATGGASLTSCANMDPALQAGLAGIVTGTATGVIGHHNGWSGAQSAAIGVATGIATAAIVYYVAKRRATQAQIAACQERGRSYTARVASGKARAPKTRYVMVEAPKTAENTGKSNVMRFDTKTNQVVGSNVYELGSKPSNGQTVSFGTGSAEYVSTR